MVTLMDRQAPTRRAKISVTVDSRLLGEVDAFVRSHPGIDRSKVVDAALLLWYAREQDHAMAAQFASEDAPQSEEWASWQAIRTAAAQRIFVDRG